MCSWEWSIIIPDRMAGHTAHFNQTGLIVIKNKQTKNNFTGGEKFPKPESENYLSDLHKKTLYYINSPQQTIEGNWDRVIK